MQQKNTLCTLCFEHMPWRQRPTKILSEHITLYAPLRYEGCIQTLIQRFKFHHDFLAGKLLAELFIQAPTFCPYQQPDYLVPVPLHWWRLFRRGFNQAGLLAQDIHKALNIPVKHTLCYRQRWTPPQTSSSARARRRNLKRAFQSRHSVTNMHIAIIDDVYTTGSTTQALAQCLLKAGAQQVDIWCIARVS